jgi:hypothetical protein
MKMIVDGSKVFRERASNASKAGSRKPLDPSKFACQQSGRIVAPNSHNAAISSLLAEVRFPTVDDFRGCSSHNVYQIGEALSSAAIVLPDQDFRAKAYKVRL